MVRPPEQRGLCGARCRGGPALRTTVALSCCGRRPGSGEDPLRGPSSPEQGAALRQRLREAKARLRIDSSSAAEGSPNSNRCRGSHRRFLRRRGGENGKILPFKKGMGGRENGSLNPSRTSLCGFFSLLRARRLRVPAPAVCSGLLPQSTNRPERSPEGPGNESTTRKPLQHRPSAHYYRTCSQCNTFISSFLFA